MNSRQKQIMEAIIREYQKTGQPVASQVLAGQYFDFSPATIRSEMLALDKEGMLEQPHHSAGRIPTTRAYRLFVNEFLKEPDERIGSQQNLKKKIANIDPFSRQLAAILADFSHHLGLAGSFGGDFHEAGFSSLFDDEELSDREAMMEIMRGFDTFEKKFDLIFENIDEETEVFIGEENPIKDFSCCAMIISAWENEGEKGFMGILGPKRMNYEKNISLLEEIKKNLNKQEI